MLDSVRQHLLRMQHRMKSEADKHRTKRTFEVGDEVFLRLQPYIQVSVARRANHKLGFKFFGPFKVLARVGAVAYKLELPSSSRVHPVFHVAQLKSCIGPRPSASTVLPDPEDILRVPARVLQRRTQQRGARAVQQVLVQWSGASEEAATWEDRDPLRQAFPRAPAWGQAGLEDGGLSATWPHTTVTLGRRAQLSGSQDPEGRRKPPRGCLPASGWRNHLLMLMRRYLSG